MDSFRRDYKALADAAEALRAIAHPVRLCILRGLLNEGACNVSKMQDCLTLPQSTVSQHLGKLRALGLVEGERHGTEVFYRVASPLAERVVRAVLAETDLGDKSTE